MFPLIGGLMSGGASLLGSIFSSETSASNTQAQIQASQQQQATQNQFQEQMSNTAYQRATADMKAAGLNPALMFGSGSAASTPSGSTIQAPMPQRTSAMAGLGEAVKSGVSTMVDAKTMDVLTQKVANMQAEKNLTDTQERVASNTAQLQRPEVRAALVRMGMPDQLINALVYGHDISKGVEGVGDALWSLVPGGKFLRSIVGGGTAKSEATSGSSAPAFSPTQNKRIMDLIEQNKGSSAKSMERGMPNRIDPDAIRGMKEGLDKFMQKHYGLGGRNPGTGGSYD